MKPPAAKTKSRPRAVDTRTEAILLSLRDARKAAVKSARMHRTPVVYLRDGSVVKVRG